MNIFDTLNLERSINKDFAKHNLLYNRIKYESLIINMQDFNEQLGSLYQYSIIDFHTMISENKKEFISEITYKIGDYFYIYFTNKNDDIIISKNKKNKENYIFDNLYEMYCIFFYPIEDSIYFDKEVYDSIKQLLNSYLQKLEYANSSLYMISMNKYGSYELTGYELKENYKLINPDIHYGTGFQEFHKKLLNTLKKSDKGIVFLYGESGTGKTYYIKCLMNELKKIKKNIIYFPNAMIDSLSDPSIFTFLYDELSKYGNEKFIFLLEDCEDYLLKRNHVNTKGLKIYDLLNASDGVMNELLNIQFIMTFNTDIINIDDAFLRPKRLIAKKEFKRLSIDESKKLAEFLHLNINIDKGYTLAELYAIRDNDSIIEHITNNDITTKKIGF